MATITCSTSRGLVYVDLNVNERSGSGSQSTNKSTIDYSVVIRKGSISWDTSWNAWGQRIYATYYIEGLGTKTVYIPTYNYNGNVPPGSTIASGSFEIEHSNDGSKTVAFNISFTDNANGNNDGFYYTPGNGAQVSGSLTCAVIPRYTTVSTWSVASKTETSITLNWKTSETVKSIRYGTSTSSYSTATVDSTSGQVTISGLSANTSYNLYFMPCKKDSSLWGDGSDGTWKSLSGQSTYDWPKINSTPDLTIGNSLRIGIYNPLNRSVQVYIKGDNGNELGGDTTTGDHIDGYNDAGWKSFWYNSIPNKTGLDSNNKAQYKVRLVCSAVSRSTTVNGGYYRIKNDGTEIPNFSDSNWSYLGNKTNLTGTNQTIIKQYSTITFNVGTAATSSYGATIVKYVYKWGTQSKDSTSGNTLSGGLTNVLEVDAVDSRGLIKATTKTLISGTNFVPYNTPSLDYSNCYTHRTDGILAETKLTLRGNLSVMKFGSSGVANALKSVQYKVYDYSTNQWSGPYTIPVDSLTLQSSGYFSLNNYTIHANGSSGGFTTGKRYAIQIILKDADGTLSTLTSNNISVTDGKISRDVYQDSNGDYHQGINGMANDNFANTIHGSENITDALYINGVKMIWYE